MKRFRFALWFCGLLALATAYAAIAEPPSGRPPAGPLERYEPKLYDVTFGVMLKSQPNADVNNLQSRYKLADAPIVMPLIYLGTFSKVFNDSIKARLWLDGRESDPHLQFKSGYPFSTTLATLTIDQFQGSEIRWQVGYRTQSWSARINDDAAAKVPWPEEWPKEVADGLKPQLYIESDDKLFAEAVQHVTNGNLQNVPPYLAAKELVRYCINQVQTTGDGTDRGAFRTLLGMEMSGALWAATNNRGSPHDLVCVCVALLRAAGIPARPVIGAYENRRGREDFVSWAEFYLPETGWVPFDPYVMRGKGIRTLDVHKPWPEFGTMKDLNERVTLAYHFIPPASVQSPRSPAVWGWDPRPEPDATGLYQIKIDIASLGRGEDDPR